MFTDYLTSFNNDLFVLLQQPTHFAFDPTVEVSKFGRWIPIRNLDMRLTLSSDSVGTRSTVSR